VSCSVCSSGRYAAHGGQAACDPCPAGKFSPPGQTACTNCSVGEEAPAERLTMARLCSVCRSCAGTFTGSSAQPQCSPCPQGQLAGVGSTACRSCSAGFVANGKGDACVPCPQGTLLTSAVTIAHQLLDDTGFVAASAATECGPCDAGRFAARAGLASCDPCPAGKTSLAGQAACTNCSIGSFLHPALAR
jgi:hypothetical protein